MAHGLLCVGYPGKDAIQTTGSPAIALDVDLASLL
jgi:hypothetical protein